MPRKLPPAALTQSALADALGLTPGAVTRMKAKGMPVDSFEAAVAWRAANTDPVRDTNSRNAREAAHGALTDDDQSDSEPSDARAAYMRAKADREATEARIARLKEQEIAGALVHRQAIRAALATKVAGVREAIRQIPARVAPELAAMATQDECYELLEREIDEALAGLGTLS